MKSFVSLYKTFFADRRIVKLALVALLFLVISVFINFYAGMYANVSQSNYVTDIILSNTRAFDVDMLFVYSTFIAFVAIILYCIKKPFQISYIVKSIALFVAIRSAFIILTHIGAYPTSIPMDQNMTFYSFFSHFSFTGDLFFSGHTGLPFLLALIAWKNKLLRYFLLAVTLYFATIVLMWHLHYSIDVLSAFFISYGIYHISLLCFPEDKKYFDASFENVSQ